MTYDNQQAANTMPTTAVNLAGMLKRFNQRFVLLEKIELAILAGSTKNCSYTMTDEGNGSQ